MVSLIETCDNWFRGVGEISGERATVDDGRETVDDGRVTVAFGLRSLPCASVDNVVDKAFFWSLENDLLYDLIEASLR